MNPLVYQIIHYTGIFILLFALGSVFTKYNKAAVIGHGIGLLLILLGGFGMQAKLQIGFPNWLIAKIVIWLIFGASVALAKKQKLTGVTAWIVMIGLAVIASCLAVFKPF